MGNHLALLWRDLGHGTRLLRKSPGFALIAVAALSIGVGANVTIFGFVTAVLLRPLDAASPERLIRAYSDGKNPVSLVAYDDYLRYRDANQSLEGLAMFHWGGLAPVRGTGSNGGPPEMIHRMPVTGNFFQILGVPAALGRTIVADDDRPAAPGVAMLSYICWQRHFAADPQVIGRTIYIDRIPLTVVGVAPAAFSGVSALLSFRSFMSRGMDPMAAGTRRKADI